jgi:EAL domain-containing protein (putative c-di-GMP-specific phosphodiesterase class I)
MDDFGTGHSSLASLRVLPFDRIKIDRSFITELGAANNTEGEKIVAAIVALGRSLGLPTVAEGIEDADTARRAKALGCRVGQGWYFGYPVPAAEVPKVIAATAHC